MACCRLPATPCEGERERGREGERERGREGEGERGRGRERDNLNTKVKHSSFYVAINNSQLNGPHVAYHYAGTVHKLPSSIWKIMFDRWPPSHD